MPDETKTRKPRSDKGFPRKIENFMVVVTDKNGQQRLAVGTEAKYEVAGSEAALAPTLFFATVADFKTWLDANAKLGETYQPVEAVGLPWCFQVAPQGTMGV